MKPRGRSPAPAGPCTSNRTLGNEEQSSYRIGLSVEPDDVSSLLTPSPQHEASLLSASTSGVSVGFHVSPSHHRHAALSSELSGSPTSANLSASGAASSSASAAGVTVAPATGPSGAEAQSLGNSVFYDETDVGGRRMSQSKQQQTGQIQAKMVKTRERIKLEQTNQDKNVNEYLKLHSNASNTQQAARIKEMFEKKNQRSTQIISQLQKKLEEYEKRKRDLEASPESTIYLSYSRSGGGGGGGGGKSHKVREKLKDVSGNITKMSSSVMSKPKEIADLIMRGGKSGQQKYGSADNLSSLSGSDSNNSRKGSGIHQGSSSLPRDGGGSVGRGSLLSGGGGAYNEGRKCLSEDGQRNRSTPSVSDATSESIPSPSLPATASSQPPPSSTHLSSSHVPSGATVSPQRGPDDTTGTEWNAVMQELALHKEEVQGLREGMDELRQQFKQDIEAMAYQAREEGEKSVRLEEQLNDLIELHQNEIEHIKNMVTDHEEIALYQNEERLRDIKESLKMLETKMTNIEVQQVQQQYLHIEGLNSTDARALMMKLITAAITFVHVLLFVAGLVVNFLAPFVRTTTRLLSTSLAVALIAGCYYQWDYCFATFQRFKRGGNLDRG